MMTEADEFERQMQATINMIDYDLPYLHNQHWARIAEEIRDQIRAATPAEKAAAEQRMSDHYEKRFDSASSRDAIIEQFRVAKMLKERQTREKQQAKVS